MYIGNCKNVTYSYTRFGGKVAIEPDLTENGATVFKWSRVCNTGIEIHAKLDKEYYVGALTLTFLPRSRISGIKLYASSKQIGSYSAGDGNLSGGRITVNAGAFTDEITARIESGIFDISFLEPEISVFDGDTPVLWPTPKCATYKNGTVAISGVTGEGTDGLFAAEFLSELVKERFGDIMTDGGVPVAVKISSELKGEGYLVSVKESGVELIASKRISLLYAAYALISLYENGQFRIAEIENYPSKEFRGFHMGLPKVSNIPFTKRLFRDMLLPLGYNTLFVQVFGSMEYERHPEITEAWRKQLQIDPNFPHHDLGCEGETITKKEVSDLVDYARELGFEIIPEVQTLGHVQWLTFPHPEIAEAVKHNVTVDDTRSEDARPSESYFHCYCPSNEKSYELIFDVIDEVIEATKPQRYVHIGHDEVYNMGLCDKCKDTPHDVLFARDVQRLYDYLKKRGYGTMMWSDMLQPCSDYQTPPARKVLPRDIVMLDFIWYFHLDKDIEENLYEEGYNIIAGNFYSSHYPRYAKRSKNEHFLGGEVSTWCAINEEALGTNGKLWDIMYSAEMLWNHESYDDAHRKAFNYVISRYLQPTMRDLLRNKYSVKGYVSTELPLPDGSKDGIPSELLSMYPSAVIADGVKVKVGKSFDRLVIDHIALEKEIRVPFRSPILSGAYTVRYSDGSEWRIDVGYAGNVMKYDTAYAMPYHEQLYRHAGYAGTWFSDPAYEGKTVSGGDLTVMRLVAENPAPEKEIESVSYTSAENDVTSVVLCSLNGSTKNK